jgi:hypothetical protein
MGQDGNGTDILSDPLWAAAVPLAEAAAAVITSDLVVRRASLVSWRVLTVTAAQGGLTQDLLHNARSSEELVPYPHARALLTRLSKESTTPDAASVARSLEKQLTAMNEDFKARDAARRLWTRLHRAMAEGGLQIAQRILSDPRIEATPKLYPELAQRYHRVSISVRRALDRGLTVLRNAIVGYAEERGWEIVATDRRVVIDHLVTIELAENRTTRVQATRVRSLAWGAVKPVLDREYERVWGRARRESSTFLIDFEGFLASRRGDNVRLRDVYEALKQARPEVPGRLVTYYRDEFSADLSVLLTTAAARRFEFSAIRDPRLAFAVVQTGGSLQQYGFVRVRGD